MTVCEESASVILGVTSSVPSLPLPNVLLVASVTWPQARLSTCRSPGCAPVITLHRYVELQICDRLQRILRVRTVTEKISYLRLHEKHPDVVFQLWIRLVRILQKGLSFTTKDPRIQFTHCLVPKMPSSSTESIPESSLPSSSQPSENFMLFAAEQASGSLLNFSAKSPFTADRNTDTTIEINNSNGYIKMPTPVASPISLNIPMRATLSHSFWEQENPEDLLQAPVASSLGENLLRP